jgi:uncharacterized membrane protein
MKKSRHLITILILIILCFGNAKQSLAASFQGLGDLPGKRFSSEALDISGDGSTVVGSSSSFRDGHEAFIWDQEHGMKTLGQIEGSSWSSLNLKISNDGATVIGDDWLLNDHKLKDRCLMWNQKDGIKILNNIIVDEKFHCTDLSSDGSVIVGYRILPDERTEAVFWHNGDGIQTLGKPKNHNLKIESFESKALSVSSDGKIIVGLMGGKNDRKAFVWNESNGMQNIGNLEGGESSSLAWTVSANGSTVIGKSFTSNGIDEAFIWDEHNGMRRLVDLKEDIFASQAYGVSEDGSIVVGDAYRPYRLAFIWDQKNKMRSLKSTLTNDYELDLEKWILISASSISDDGKTIVGVGSNPNGNLEAWIAKLDS